MSTEELRLLFRRIAVGMLAADALGILAHVVAGGSDVVNLDAEANLPTWYSSTKLLCIALAGVIAWRVEKDDAAHGLRAVPHRFLWLGLSFVFLGMSADETAQMHERTARWAVQDGFARQLRYSLVGGDATKDSFVWPVLFAPVGVAVVFFLASFAWTRRERLKRVLWLGAAGLGFYVLAVVLEPAAVYFAPKMAQWTEQDREKYDAFSLVEESCEIVGTTFLFLTALSYVVIARREQLESVARAAPAASEPDPFTPLG